jgi:hypothetical protein
VTFGAKTCVLTVAVSTLSRNDITGAAARLLLGERMLIMQNNAVFETYLKAKDILCRHFKEEFPNGDFNKFNSTLASYSKEDIIRLADAVSRFGLAAILDVIL